MNPDVGYGGSAADAAGTGAATHKVEQSSQLPLEVGERFMIRLGWGDDKQSSETPAVLVGYSHYEFLILQPKAFPGIAGYTAPGTAVTARFLHDGAVYMFRADVISYVGKPCLMLFVSYPYSQSTVPVRKHKRVQCALPVLAVMGEDSVYGIIDDLSKGGCRLVLSVNGPGTRKIKKDDTLTLQMVILPDTGMSTVEATVKSVEREQYRVFLGLSFTKVGDVLADSFEKFFTLADEVL